MRWLNGVLRGRRRDENGAVALILAMLLGGGLLLGCVALTVDLGSLTSQRREIQNAADAVALSAAQTCAATNTCPAASDPELTELAKDNDDTSTIVKLCGDGPDLTPCDALTGGLEDCPVPDQPFDGNYVRAYTERHTTFSFAPAIGGGDGKDQSTCSSAGWGPLGKHQAALPVTFSYCEWSQAVGSNDPESGEGTYAANPPTPSDAEQVIYLNKPNSTDGSCATWQGHDAPGGFGWLDSGGSCSSSVSTDGWVQVDTGNNTPNPCKDVLPSLRGTVIQIPVYDCQSRVESYPTDLADCVTGGNGNNHYYHIVGFAAFYISGWHLSGDTEPSIVTGNQLCTGGDRCLYGYFVNDVVSDGDASTDPDAPDFGIRVVKLIG